MCWHCGGTVRPDVLKYQTAGSSKHLCGSVQVLFCLQRYYNQISKDLLNQRIWSKGGCVTPNFFYQCFSQCQHVVHDLGSIDLVQLSKLPYEYRVAAVERFPVKPVKRNNWCCSQPTYSPIIPWEMSYCFFFKKKTKQKAQGHTKLTFPCRYNNPPPSIMCVSL